jgi:hypothetical protein
VNGVRMTKRAMPVLMRVGLCLCWCEGCWVVDVEKEMFLPVCQVKVLSERLLSFCLTGFY